MEALILFESDLTRRSRNLGISDGIPSMRYGSLCPPFFLSPLHVLLVRSSRQARLDISGDAMKSSTCAFLLVAWSTIAQAAGADVDPTDLTSYPSCVVCRPSKAGGVFVWL